MRTFSLPCRFRARRVSALLTCSVTFALALLGCSSGGSTPSPAGASGSTSSAGQGGTANVAVAGATSSTAGSMQSSAGASVGGSLGQGGSVAGAASTAGSGGSVSGAGGAAGSSAGASNAGTGGGAGAGGGAAVNGCMGVTASFCDDFEAQTTGQAPKGAYTVAQSGMGTLLIETSKPYSGTKSAHIHVPQGAGGNDDPTAQLTFKNQFPMMNNDLFGRAMVFLTKNPNGSNKPNIHWDLLSADGGGKTYTLGSMYNDKAKAGAFMPVYQPGDRSIDTSTPWPEGAWACIQWEFKYAAGTGDVLQIKMDGKAIDLGKTTAEGSPINGTNIPAWPAGAWSRLIFGYVHFSSPTPIDVDLWFDDLAIGPQEIPCPAAK